MHGYSPMTSPIIDLELPAYELLLRRREHGESFSEEIQRLFGGKAPILKGFLDIVSAVDGQAMADAVETIRTIELNEKQWKASRDRQRHRHHA